MDVLALFLLILSGCYLAPILMPRWTWLAALAGAGALAGVGLWFGWVEQQTDSISSGLAALFADPGAPPARAAMAHLRW